MKKIILVSLLSLLFIPLIANASLNTNLYYGLQQNSGVKQLQEFLISKGFLTGNATGNFFSLTLKAVKAYQKNVNLNSTGYVGTLTRTAINKDLTANPSSSNNEATNKTGTTSQIITQNNPQPPVWDACKNIDGVQPLAPAGMYADNGNCFPLNTSSNAQNATPVPTPTPTPTPSTSPMVDIKANGSDGPINVFYGASPTISWTSQGMLNCNITKSDGGQWQNVNTSGSINLGQLGSGVLTVRIQCSGQKLPNGDMVNSTVSDSVVINVGTDPTPPPQIGGVVFSINNNFNSSVSSGTRIKVASFYIKAITQSATNVSLSLKLSDNAMSVFSNFRAVIEGQDTGLFFSSDGTYNFGSFQIPVINNAGDSRFNNGETLDIYADVASNIIFGPAPVLTITSAHILSGNETEPMPTTLPINGQIVTVK